MTNKEKREIEIFKKKEISHTGGEPTRQGVLFVPEVDILDNGEAITLFADLPGVKPENLDVDVREGVLTLTATVDPPQEKLRAIHQEYTVGGYQRSFTLGERIDTEKISARFTNGVLELKLPKQEKLKPRKIKISS